jgi:Tfp pilus assembly protein PilF
LRVLARTSSFSFQNRDVDTVTIARALGATHVLTGSLRKSDDGLSITAQLVGGAATSPAWRKTYDRRREDAAAILVEIATEVAAALNSTVAGNRIDNSTAADPRAYEHFLLARFFFNRRQSGDISQAESAYRRSLQFDSTAARTWAGLAGVYYLSLWNNELGLSRDETLERMRDAADQALTLDPNVAEAHLRLSAHRLLTGDRHGAREHERRAAELEPDNPMVLSGLAGDALAEGRPNDAIAFQRRAVLRDPMNLVARANLGTILYFAGRPDEAAAELRTVLQFTGTPDAAWQNPDSPASAAAISLAKVLIVTRRFDEALTLIQSWPMGQYRDQCLALVYHALGNIGESNAALERLATSQTTEPHWVAEAYAQRGEVDQAFRWIASAAARSRESGDPVHLWRLDIRYSPFVASLHRDRRWKAWLAETSG